MEFDGLRDPYLEFSKENPELAARVQAAVDKGRTQLEQGLLEEARREFQRALAIYPYVPAALNNMALLAYGDGDRERAKMYLEQLLAFSPAEPTANALMAKHWHEDGAAPLAVRHAEAAVRSMIALSTREETNDPTRIRRSLEFCCQALIELEDDELLVRLYSEIGGPVLLPTSLVHVAIAYYNRGHFDTAVKLWQLALEMEPEETAAQVYLEMAEVIKQHQLLPFQLDHRIEDPDSETNQHAWFMRLPSLALASALTQVYRGTSTEAEESLPLLTGVGIAGFRLIMMQVANDITRPERLRLLAGLQMVVAGEIGAAAAVAEAIPRQVLSGEEEALWCLLSAMLAEVNEHHDEAGHLAVEGLQLLDGADLPADHPFRQMLTTLARFDQGKNGSKPSKPAAKRVRKTASTTKKPGALASEGMFRLPDAEWLRIALQHPVVSTLEESLGYRPREVVTELARRLGEQNPEKMDDNSLVRRLAMRLRSLPLDRVVGALSPAGRQLLQWLAKQDHPQTLAKMHNWLSSELLETDPWPVVEELYFAGLVDIGRSEGSPASAPLQVNDMMVSIPADLYGRFGQKA